MNDEGSSLLEIGRGQIRRQDSCLLVVSLVKYDLH